MAKKTKPVILVVDDQPQNIELLEAYLVPQGYEIVKAANGEEALEKLSGNQIDLILLDVIMPGMDGFEVIRRIRQDNVHRMVPIILVTSLKEPEDRVKGMEAGCDDFISKPVDKVELLARVRSLLMVKDYNDLMSNYRKELESEITRRSKELDQSLENLQEEITERKKAEEALVKLRKAVEASGEVVFLTDPDGTITFINPEFTRLYGYSATEVVGKATPRILKSGTMEPDNYEFFWQTILKGQVVRGEMVNKTKDGRLLNIEGSANPILDEAGNIIGFLAIQRDITERKKVEGLLRFQGEILQNMSEGVQVTRVMDQVIVFTNSRFEKMFGYGQGELLGKHVSVLNAPAEHIPQEVAEEIIKGMEENGAWHGEVHNIKKDGNTFWCHASVATFEHPTHGKVWIAVHQDITESKKMQEQLMAQDRLASIGQLVSGVAHEINNPLTGVIGFSELLLKRDLPDDVKADLKVINEEANRTATIVKNLLTFARKQPEGKTPVDINENIRTVMNLRDHEQKVNNIRVITNFASDLPQVIGNSSQLQQVFFNIVINAEFFMIEAHQKGILTITTERVGDTVRVSFADDGPGISEEHKRKLFTPFFTTKEVGKGTGLGLSICYGIITEHGGRMYAESEPGKGATFIVELPITQVAINHEAVR